MHGTLNFLFFFKFLLINYKNYIIISILGILYHIVFRLKWVIVLTADLLEIVRIRIQFLRTI